MKKLVTFLLLVTSAITVAQDIKVTTKDNDLKLPATSPRGATRPTPPGWASR